MNMPDKNDQEGSAPEQDCPQSGGLTKLMNDLRGAPCEISAVAPSGLKQAVLDRIDKEPACVETDLDGRILATNPAFSKLCGYAYSEIQGKKPGAFLQGAETCPHEVEKLRQAIRARHPVEVEITNYHKDGAPYRVKIAIEPIVDQSGQPTGFLAKETLLVC